MSLLLSDLQRFAYHGKSKCSSLKDDENKGNEKPPTSNKASAVPLTSSSLLPTCSSSNFTGRKLGAVRRGAKRRKRYYKLLSSSEEEGSVSEDSESSSPFTESSEQTFPTTIFSALPICKWSKRTAGKTCSDTENKTFDDVTDRGCMETAPPYRHVHVHDGEGSPKSSDDTLHQHQRREIGVGLKLDEENLCQANTFLAGESMALIIESK